jgi:ATP-dependent Clp protease adaptor protein ClpS
MSAKELLLTKHKVSKPPLYKVIMHNDDFSTKDFVIAVLMRFFGHSLSKATFITNEIHHKGMAIAGVYPLDIAQTKVAQVETVAMQQEMPLQLSIEPESKEE